MLPYLRYKEKEYELQKAFGSVPVTIEAISGSDHYYTDGESTKSAFKVVIDSVKTVYVPQFMYNVNAVDKGLIMEWIKKVEKVE